MTEVNKLPLDNYGFVKSAGLKNILDEDKSGKITLEDFQKMSPSKLRLAEKAVKADTILTKQQKEIIFSALKLASETQLNSVIKNILEKHMGPKSLLDDYTDNIR